MSLEKWVGKWGKLPSAIYAHQMNKGAPRVVVSIWDAENISPQKDRERFGIPSVNVRELHPAPFIPTQVLCCLLWYGGDAKVVADVMCGIGTTLAVARRLGKVVVGVDIEPTFVKLAKRLGDVVLGDARFLPFKNGAFDYVVFSPPYWDVRSYLSKGNIGNLRSYSAYLGAMRLVLGEVRRVLKSGRLVTVIVKDPKRGGVWIPLHVDITNLAREVGLVPYDHVVWKLNFVDHRVFHLWRKLQAKGDRRTFTVHEHILTFEKS